MRLTSGPELGQHTKAHTTHRGEHHMTHGGQVRGDGASSTAEAAAAAAAGAAQGVHAAAVVIVGCNIRGGPGGVAADEAGESFVQPPPNALEQLAAAANTSHSDAARLHTVETR